MGRADWMGALRAAAGACHLSRVCQGNPPFLQEAVALRCPDLSALVAVSTLPEGGGHADWVDALMVAGDALAKDVKERSVLGKAPKRIVLVSDLRARVGKLGNLEDMLEILPTALSNLKARRCPGLSTC